MAEDSEDNSSEKLLRAQYVSLRDEAIARVEGRRRLMAAGLAFVAAFSGFVYKSGGRLADTSSNTGTIPTHPNAWLTALLPLIIAFLAFEVFRSERQLERINRHMGRIEEKSLNNPHWYGWESGPGGGSNILRVIALVILSVVYGALVWVAIASWETAPEIFFFSRESLFYAYLGVGAAVLAMIVVFLRYPEENDGILLTQTDRKALQNTGYGKSLLRKHYEGNIQERIGILEEEAEFLAEEAPELFTELEARIQQVNPVEERVDEQTTAENQP